MDSSSPPLSSGEEDGAAAVAAGLAKEAALLFHAGKFVECLRILNQLLLKKPDDPKVRHNIAIAESFQDGSSDPKRLIEALENVKEQCEKLARTFEEGSEIAENNGCKHTEGTKGNDLHQFSSSSVYSDEFDTSVAMFNIAVIWFHLHEYGKSFSYLNTLYQNIEPVGEGIALRIRLLLLDVALLSYRASRSAEVISYMEKVFCVNTSTSQVDSGTSAQQQPLVGSKSSFISNSTFPDASHSDSVVTTNPSENSLTRTLSEEALEDESLQLLSSLDISGRQKLQRPPGIASLAEESSLSAPDLRHKLLLYKVRFWLLTRNLKAAKREVKMAMNVARGKDYQMALYLKSQLEYDRGNHQKAIKLLLASTSSSTETPPGVISNIMYNNNLGCIYYQLGKYHTSGVFFSKALKSTSLVRKEKPRKLLNFSQDKSVLIAYNCGVHSLACCRPFHAARSFQTASLIFHNRPLLWIRMAECCLMALEKGLIKSTSSAKSEIRVNVIGKGKWRQLALRHDGTTSPSKHQDSSEGKQPDLSMSLAWKCLVNALHLLDSEESESRQTLNTNYKNVIVDDDAKVSNVVSGSNGELKEQKGGNNQRGSFENAITSYEHIRMKENHMMKQATLADMAYVELELGNPLKALSTAKSLINLPDRSRMYTFLGTIYAAEALCLINKPKEAAEHLMMYISSSGNDNFELPYSQEDCEKWWSVEKVLDNEESNVGGTNSGGPHRSAFCSPEEGRGILCANYAANFALLGDLDKAHVFVVKALSDIPKSSQAVLTAIYVDLKRGKTQDALAKLKQHTSVRYVPGSLTLDGSS